MFFQKNPFLIFSKARQDDFSYSDTNIEHFRCNRCEFVNILKEIEDIKSSGASLYIRHEEIFRKVYKNFTDAASVIK